MKRIFIWAVIAVLSTGLGACAPGGSAVQGTETDQASFDSKISGLLNISVEAPIASTFSVNEKNSNGQTIRHRRINEVSVHFEKVRILMRTDMKQAWVQFPDKSGSLSMSGSSAKLDLSSLEIPQGVEVSDLRFILNEVGNYVTFNDGSTCQLKTPSAQQSGLKLKLSHPVLIEAGKKYELKLRWDVEKSVVLTGNGGCILKPVIRACIERITDGDEDDYDGDDGSTTTTTMPPTDDDTGSTTTTMPPEDSDGGTTSTTQPPADDGSGSTTTTTTMPPTDEGSGSTTTTMPPSDGSEDTTGGSSSSTTTTMIDDYIVTIDSGVSFNYFAQ